MKSQVINIVIASSEHMNDQVKPCETQNYRLLATLFYSKNLNLGKPFWAFFKIALAS